MSDGADLDWTIQLALTCDGELHAVSRVAASLRTLGGELADAFVTRQGSPVPASWYWKGAAADEALDDQIPHLLTRLEEADPPLADLGTSEAAEIELVAKVRTSCGLYPTDDAQMGVRIGSISWVPLTVPADMLIRLGRLGLSLRLDLEVPDSEDV